MNTNIIDFFKALKRPAQKAFLSAVNWQALNDVGTFPIQFFTRDEIDDLAGMFSEQPANTERKTEIARAAAARALAMKEIYEAGKPKSREVKPAGSDIDGVTDVRKFRTRNQEILENIQKKAKIEDQHDTVPELETAESPEQLELFNADLIIDYGLRDEVNGMSISMYALAKKPERGIWRWDSQDGKRWIEISSQFLAEQMDGAVPKDGELVHGRATVFDKDIIIYSISKINEAMERKLPVGPKIRFTAYDFFKATRREASGRDYENMLATLRRLRSTNVESNIIAADGQTTRISGIINDAEVKRGVRGELQYVELTLADWLYKAIKTHNVLAINPDYFKLTRPLERVLYSIARKHVGNQGIWKISLEKLKDKCGAAPNSPLRRFLFDIKQVIEADNLPDYRLSVKKEDGEYMATFYSKDSKQVALAFTKKKKH